MCGIFGSNNIDNFKELYRKNTERGNFVRSITKLFPGGMENDIRVETKYDQQLYNPIEENPFCIYYLGHVQSPTSKIREFNKETSHPFYLNNQYLAHNGVLENDRDLIKGYSEFHHIQYFQYLNQKHSSLIQQTLNQAMF